MRKLKLFLFFILPSFFTFANVDDTILSVWANEAIVATYTLDATHYMQQQKKIAHYFTNSGWGAFVSAFNQSGIPKAIQANNFEVSAVAMMPPTVKPYGTNQWVADMPLLVVYKNTDKQVKQTLGIKIQFKAVTQQGVRGFAIERFSATTITEPCECVPQAPNPAPKKSE